MTKVAISGEQRYKDGIEWRSVSTRRQHPRCKPRVPRRHRARELKFFLGKVEWVTGNGNGKVRGVMEASAALSRRVAGAWNRSCMEGSERCIGRAMDHVELWHMLSPRRG